MSLFNSLPWTNFHELNLNWLIKRIKGLDDILIINLYCNKTTQKMTIDRTWDELMQAHYYDHKQWFTLVTEYNEDSIYGRSTSYALSATFDTGSKQITFRGIPRMQRHTQSGETDTYNTVIYQKIWRYSFTDPTLNRISNQEAHITADDYIINNEEWT